MASLPLAAAATAATAEPADLAERVERDLPSQIIHLGPRAATAVPVASQAREETRHQESPVTAETGELQALQVQADP